MAKFTPLLLLCLLTAAAASRVSLRDLGSAGRKLQSDSLRIVWRLGITYETIYLVVGDSATFRWAGDGEHSVALAPGPGICTGLREVSENGEQGEYTVTFGTPGTFVYTSDENNDCESGLAIVIVVESDDGAPEMELYA
ncbi:hypothetical protein ACKKBF_B32615 [Auxenochlorella protothecoides x Auxenochlorella symbiontica]